MERQPIETVEVKVPSGYTIVLKKRLTYGERLQIINATVGDQEVETGEKAKKEIKDDFKIKVQEAYTGSILSTFYRIASWDVTVDGQPLPITLDSVKETLFEEDIDALDAIIEAFPKPDPKAETRS